MWLLPLALACTSDDDYSDSDMTEDSSEALLGCRDPATWSLGGNGRYCEGSCDGQGIVCAETMSPPRCMVTAREGGRTDCDLPPTVEDEELCETAILTTCTTLIDP